jgi:hypothetical protein
MWFAWRGNKNGTPLMAIAHSPMLVFWQWRDVNAGQKRSPNPLESFFESTPTNFEG